MKETDQDRCYQRYSHASASKMPTVNASCPIRKRMCNCWSVMRQAPLHQIGKMRLGVAARLNIFDESRFARLKFGF